ncbi:uncharacterized protein EI97DRAFT_454956 [Westerdykella ornata]|uniref:Lysine-specific metallo-endopeptidase domain-containing protein n=1 Tax=Westerdykella ornata TaxID=318751 RepID=A0A6A6JYB8_WESOR|nr:uncharacterized protein EI97DRAFT_454956 [Westerdykella ornata]KAF2280019.1 hypothetical protein EI97DRAFT_454956 [Westerdykella ornata]
MRSHTLLLHSLVSLGLSEASQLKTRGWKFSGSCDQGKQDVIKTELKHAKELVDTAAANVKDGVYYDTFFAQSLRDDPNFSTKVSNVFSKVSKMLDDANHDYDFEITCDNNTDMCKAKYYAHMGDSKKRMNFCDVFFSPSGGIKPTQERLDKCGEITLKEAQWSRSSILVHECTHTGFAMDPEKRTLDYAYGFSANYLLPLGKWNRDCAPYKKAGKVLCPDPNDPKKEGICDAEKSAENADTYSFVAAGVGFSKLCKRAIPLPPAPSAKRALSRRAECPADDAIPFDDGADEDFNGSGPVGKCGLDIEELWTCEPDTNNLYGRMTITAPDGNVLYETGGSTRSPGVPIGDQQRPTIQEEGMSKGLQVIAEHENDYIQFYYGDVAWTSGTTEGEATCKLVGDNWDTESPVQCDQGARSRRFQCQYPC